MKPKPNRLHYGDNLRIMERMPSASVDLIYLDPPFKSDQNYNLLYRTMTGKPVPDQAQAFCDTWDMDAEKERIAQSMPVLMREKGIDDYYVEFWRLWMKALRHTQPHLLAYLIYMVERLLYMKAILKPHGSVYLHCDPTASHYIKVMMDGIFGHQNFRNEIIWKRTSAHSGAKRYGPIHDVLLYYTNSDRYTWNKVYQPYEQSYVDSKFGKVDKATGKPFTDHDLTGPGTRTGESGQPWRGHDPTAKGRHWQPASYLYAKYKELTGVELNTFHFLERFDRLDEAGLIYWAEKRGGGTAFPRYKQFLDTGGMPLQDIWTDISPVNSMATNRLGYPTQKPPDLLKRIIEASSNPGDVVFDPFCGCGTTIYAAQETGRRWIGVDVALLAVKLIRDILTGDRYRLSEGKDFEISGIPVTTEQAHDMFKRDPFHFQKWAVEFLAGGFPNKTMVADKGIDGRIYFETRYGLKSMVLSVKGGAIRPTDVRDLRGVLSRDDAEFAGFISLREPTKAMKDEAATAGVYEYQGNSYQRIQLLTIKEMLDDKRHFETPTKVGTKVLTGQTVLPIEPTNLWPEDIERLKAKPVRRKIPKRQSQENLELGDD